MNNDNYQFRINIELLNSNVDFLSFFFLTRFSFSPPQVQFVVFLYWVCTVYLPWRLD